MRWWVGLFAWLVILGLLALEPNRASDRVWAETDRASESWDPLAYARSHLRVQNLEATVPAQCYTRTEGRSNPCYTCHTVGVPPNYLNDSDLQREYAFSPEAKQNYWTNHFSPPSPVSIAEPELLESLRIDNYSPLRRQLKGRTDYLGYVPDLDFEAGFDEFGFANDGSGWRAIKFRPFPGTFWPSAGSTNDVAIRLPLAFRTLGGEIDRAVYRANLSILEAAIGADPRVKVTEDLVRRIEPIDERPIGVDLDQSGTLEPGTTRLRGLPSHYLGDAKEIRVNRYLYPRGTEFLHTVRYLDPDDPSFRARRVKEVRYAKKVEFLDHWALQYATEEIVEEKERGRLPSYRGGAESGLLSDFGWRLQGFIEDPKGRLRLASEEEQLYCLGCHGGLGVTVDSTFSFARKIPGVAGWQLQTLNGQLDRPPLGASRGELSLYYDRVGGGDEFRVNHELKSRLAGAAADPKAAPADLPTLLFPSRERALALNRAYLGVVREQAYTRGRVPMLAPNPNIFHAIVSEATDLEAAGRIYLDGSLFVDWGTP